MEKSRVLKGFYSILAISAISFSVISCGIKQGYIKNYDAISKLSAIGIGDGSSKGKVAAKNSNHFRKDRLNLSRNLKLYFQLDGKDFYQFDVGLNNPNDYRLLNLLETDEFVELAVGSKEGLGVLQFDEWYSTSPRNTTGLINNERFDLHFYIINKKSKDVAEFVDLESRYFPHSSTVSHDGCLYSVINTPNDRDGFVYGSTSLMKYYFKDGALIKEEKVLNHALNPDCTQLYKDDKGNLYIEYTNSETYIARFNSNLEIEEEHLVLRQDRADKNGKLNSRYISPLNKIYTYEAEEIFKDAKIGFNELDKDNNEYDVRDFYYYFPGFTLENGTHSYGPTTIMTSCRLHEDNEAIYFNYGKIENNLKDYNDHFKYAKYYKDISRKWEIKEFEIDELGEIIGSDVYYIKDSNLYKFNVPNETHEKLCSLSEANLFEVSSIYLGDENKIYVEGADSSLNTIVGVIENGSFKFTSTPSEISITTLLPLN